MEMGKGATLQGKQAPSSLRLMEEVGTEVALGSTRVRSADAFFMPKGPVLAIGSQAYPKVPAARTLPDHLLRWAKRTSAPSHAALVLTAALATVLRPLVRSFAPFPQAPSLESLALSFLLSALSLTPALLAGFLGPRFARLARLLLGMPFGLLAMSLVFADGYSSRGVLFAAGLTGFPAGVLLYHVGGTRSLAAATALCLLLGAGTRLRPAYPATGHEPSVLFVVLDTTATGHLSAYGYAKPTTPALEALARRSLVYRRAISPASWTIPAHASMFTGLYPSELGFDGLRFSPQHEPGSLAGDLETTGRTSYAITANPLVGASATLRAGYRRLWQADRLTRPLPLQLFDRLRGYKEFVTRGDQITDLALDWLDRLAPRDKPWFLFLNYVDPHSPYRPPRREHDQFAPGIDPDAIEDLTQHYGSGQRQLTPAVTVAMRALYDGDVAAMDHALSRLLDELGRRGYDASNLLVVVTADHGEALGEHGLVGHVRGLPDTVLHVPLLLNGPGVSPGEVTTPVQTVQLRATVRALLGLPPLPSIASALPPWGEAPPLLITEHPEPRWYLDELSSFNAGFDPTPWAGNWVAVERDGVKVVFDDRGRGRTYRLTADPEENDPRPLAEGASLTRAYAAWHQREWNTARAPSAENRRALESMGYVH